MKLTSKKNVFVLSLFMFIGLGYYLDMKVAGGSRPGIVPGKDPGKSNDVPGVRNATSVVQVEDKLYYGSSKVVSDQFNDPEMLAKFRHPSNPALAQRFPRCVIIGSIKSGTQALLEYLDLHPGIKSAPHEIRYFKFGEKFDVIGYENEYLRKMPYSTKHQITLEKSPQYTQGVDERVAARLQHFDPSMRLLYVVKSPIDRALGEYLHQDRAQYNKKHTHMKGFQDLITYRDGTIKHDYPALQTSNYYKMIKFWFQTFSANQIHVVDGDQLLTNPVKELKQIETFLNLEHTLSGDLFYFNKTKGFYCYYSQEETGGKSSRCLWPTKGNVHPSLNQDLVARLKKFYKPLNEKFYELVGRKFNWD